MAAAQPVSSAAATEIPVVDMTPYMNDPTSKAAKDEIAKVAYAFRNFGVVVIKDPRVDEQHNEEVFWH
jgi:isopenicillin N synthase-like dioxygenase